MRTQEQITAIKNTQSDPKQHWDILNYGNIMDLLTHYNDSSKKGIAIGNIFDLAKQDASHPKQNINTSNQSTDDQSTILFFSCFRRY